MSIVKTAGFFRNIKLALKSKESLLEANGKLAKSVSELEQHAGSLSEKLEKANKSKKWYGLGGVGIGLTGGAMLPRMRSSDQSQY